MIKKTVISAILVAVVLSAMGCAEISELTKDITKPASPASPKLVRGATLESAWVMKQIEIVVGADEEVEILLKLADQDKVDGYLYLEDGNIADFRIKGNSVIYSAMVQGAPEPGGISSARFSFVANQAEGTTYSLIFSNKDDANTSRTKQTIFLEIIYPSGGSLFIPVETD